MSLVNDMLRDLEKRKAAESSNPTAANVTRESMIEPKQSGFRKKDIVLLSLVLVVLALLVYIFLLDKQQGVSLFGTSPQSAGVSQEVSSEGEFSAKQADVSTGVKFEAAKDSHVAEPMPKAEVGVSSSFSDSSEERGSAADKGTLLPATVASPAAKVSSPVIKGSSSPAQVASVSRKQAEKVEDNRKMTEVANKPTETESVSKTHEREENTAVATVEKNDEGTKSRVGESKVGNRAVTATVSKPESLKPRDTKSAQAKSTATTDDKLVDTQAKRSTQSQGLKVVLSPSALDLKTASDAISLFEVGKPDEAYRLMKRFVAENQTIEQTLNVLANRLLQDQRFAELSDLLRRAGEPLSPGLRQVNARWLLMQGEPQMAVALLESAQPDIEIMPEYYALMASLYQRNGQAGKAFERYSQLIQSNDTVADWWAGLGIAADQMKQGRQAVFAYQQAVSLPGLNMALDKYVRQRLTALSGRQ